MARHLEKLLSYSYDGALVQNLSENFYLNKEFVGHF